MSTELFSDAPISHAARATQLVEDALAARGVDPCECRLSDDAGGRARYRMPHGDGALAIEVSPPGGTLLAPVHGRLRVEYPVAPRPSAPTADTLADLLQRNASLVGVAFALTDESVVLVAERTVEDLDAMSVSAAIESVVSAAERFGDTDVTSG